MQNADDTCWQEMRYFGKIKVDKTKNEETKRRLK